MQRVPAVEIIVMIGTLLLAGCSPCGTNHLCKSNREALPKLFGRMEPKEVVSVMKGEPYREEYYKAKKGEMILVYYYLTNIQGDKVEITDVNMSPIFFVDYELVGWGVSYWDTILKKYEPYLIKSRLVQ